MEKRPYIVYVMIDPSGYICAVNSSEFLRDTTDWVEIDRGYGDRYRLAQNNYFDEYIITNDEVYRYKLLDGTPVECTEEEMEQQREVMKPVPRVPRNIIAGEYVTVNGILYKAIANIPNGERIVAGQNAVETTIEEQLYELAKGE